MERLTNIGSNGEIWITDNDETRRFGRKETAYRKLKEYEDLEEQGLLFRLPCKVGDTIYVVPSIINYKINNMHGYSENNRLYEQIVYSVQMFSNDRYLLFTCDGLQSVVSDSYKKTWFLTRAEAEQKLKEMESERDG